MKILFFFLFLLLAALLMAGLNAIIRSLAYDRRQRYLHCRLAAAVFLVDLIAANVYTVSKPLQLIDAIINSPVLAPLLSVILPNRSYGLLYMLLTIIDLNLLLMLLVLVTVIVVKLVFRGKPDYPSEDEMRGGRVFLHLPWLLVTSTGYYERLGRAGELTEKGVGAGLWIRSMKRAFTVLLGLELLVFACSVLWFDETANETFRMVSKAWFLLPMAGFLLSEQLELMLEGETDARAGRFSTTSIGETVVSDLDELVDYYVRQFSGSGALLYYEKGRAQKLSSSGLSANSANSFQMMDCDQSEVLGFLLSQLRAAHVAQTVHYQDALIALLNGRSISVRDQADGEFTVYLAAYLNYNLSEGKTALILCPDRESARETAEELREQMKNLNLLYSVWSILTPEEAAGSSLLNILVCSCDDFTAQRVLDRFDSFTRSLFCVVFTDGSGFFAQDSLHIELLVNRLRALPNALQYILFSSEDNEHLRTAAKKVLRQELVPYHHDVLLPHTSIMLWKEDSCCKLQRYIGVGTALTEYMGAALPLALPAVRYDIPQVRMIQDPSRGDRTYRNVMTSLRTQISWYLKRNVDLSSVLRTDSKEAMRASQSGESITVMLVYDTDCNLFSALWRWLKYGGSSGTLLHVLSPSYLLRDYFAANLQSKQLLFDHSRYSALVPDDHVLNVSRQAGILAALCGGSMTEEELLTLAASYRWNYNGVEAMLRDCLRVILSDHEIHGVLEHFSFQKNSVSILDPAIRERLLELVSYIQVKTGDEQFALPVLRANVYNYYLRDQIAVFNGSIYQIRNIQNGLIHAQANTPDSLPEYYPISSFSFESLRLDDECVDTPLMDVNLYTADAVRHIHGYWSSVQGRNLYDDAGLSVSRLTGDNGGCLTDRMHDVSIMEIRFSRSGMQAPEKAIRLLAYMLSGLFRTLFPATWQNLYAVAGTEDGDFADRILREGTDRPFDERIRSVIPWSDQPATDRDKDRIPIYIVEFSAVEYGMVHMLYSHRYRVIQLLVEYLEWYLASQPEESAPADRTDAPKAQAGASKDSFTPQAGTYLHLGADEIPDVFAPRDLLALLRGAVPMNDEPILQPVDIAPRSNTTCSFCGTPLVSAIRIQDGRCMCAVCKAQQLTEQDEIETMFRSTVHMMEHDYGITLRTDLDVKFASVSEIKKEAGAAYQTRILGFYDSRTHRLVLEARGPAIAMQSTLLHELTHVWQYDHLNIKRLALALPLPDRDKLLLALLEGHAMYVEIQTMRRLNEDEYADRLHDDTIQRTDEYGRGYTLLHDYIQQKEGEGSHVTPFTAMEELVEDIIQGKVTIE